MAETGLLSSHIGCHILFLALSDVLGHHTPPFLPAVWLCANYTYKPKHAATKGAAKSKATGLTKQMKIGFH